MAPRLQKTGVQLQDFEETRNRAHADNVNITTAPV